MKEEGKEEDEAPVRVAADKKTNLFPDPAFEISPLHRHEGNFTT